VSAGVSAPVAPGDVLAGKYHVERVLGAGAMGVVVVAMHTQLDQRVAIKFLLPDVLGDETAVSRFAREAKAAARIRSEHVVRVIDVSTLESGAPYMVMEYLDGVDLAQMLEERGPLPVEDAVDYVLQALEALCEAHLAGIVHRDLKPSNMFLAKRPDGSPVVKILDFGISKITTAEQQSMTHTQAMLGSPLYMAPEQMRATKSVDRRADIWSMGVILHELLTGRVPFVAETMPQLISTVMFDPTPRPSQVRPELPAGIDQVVVRCLEKDAAQRFQNVGELATALAPFAPAGARLSVERIGRMLGASGAEASPDPFASSQANARAAAAGASSGSALASSGTVSHAWQATNGGVSGVKRRGPVLLVAAGALVAAGIGAAALMMGHHEAAGSGAPSAAAAAVPAERPATSAAAVDTARATPRIDGATTASPSSQPAQPAVAPASSTAAAATSKPAARSKPASEPHHPPGASPPRSAAHPAAPTATAARPPPASITDFGGRH